MIELEQFPKSPSNNNVLDKTTTVELIDNRESLLKDKDKDKNRQSTIIKKSIDTSSKSNKNIIKTKKNTNDDIDINLSVEDIIKKLDRQEKISTLKVVFIFGYLYLSLQFTNCSFICYLSYLRPPFLTNEYYCYDLESKNYFQCISHFFCKLVFFPNNLFFLDKHFKFKVLLPLYIKKSFFTYNNNLFEKSFSGVKN